MTNPIPPSSAASARQPVLYIPHGGGPCFFMDDPEGMWTSMEDFLRSIRSSLPQTPKAVLVVSGHWEEPRFTVHAGEKPGLFYDYYNFPEHTYRLRWDAPGAPDVARRALALLEDAGIGAGIETDRGWDHGVFVPMKVAWPEADIPTTQLSLRADLDPAAHVLAGKALQPLRDEGVLIVGSGMSFHNMRAREGSGMARARQFDDWLTDAVTSADTARRDRLLTHWADGTEAHYAHPREEHLIPLMVAAGAAGADKGMRVYNGDVIGWRVSGYRFG